MKLQSYYWGCQSWSYQTLTILGSGGSFTYWIEMVSTKKRGSVTLHVKTLLLTIPSPMNFSLFKENKADQAFGFGAGLVRIAKRQMLSTELVMLLVLPILLEVTHLPC